MSFCLSRLKSIESTPATGTGARQLLYQCFNKDFQMRSPLFFVLILKQVSIFLTIKIVVLASEAFEAAFRSMHLDLCYYEALIEPPMDSV